MNSNNENNLGVNIPNLLNQKYKNWGVLYPEILQLDENLEPIKVWNNKKDIAAYFGKKIQGVDLALRKCCRFRGYFWVIKILYEKEGLRPVKVDKRNTKIYAYNPPQNILDKYYNYEQLSQEDFTRDGVKETFQFIGRFKNSVAAGEFLDLSVTNIRRVAKKEILLHKDYFFSFEPLLDIHKVTAEIFDLSNKNNLGTIRDDEKDKLFKYIDNFKENHLKVKRVIGFAEEELFELLSKKEEIKEV